MTTSKNITFIKAAFATLTIFSLLVLEPKSVVQGLRRLILTDRVI